MLSPKKTKFRKQHKGRVHGKATSGATLSHGAFGLKTVEAGRLNAREIEAARRAAARETKRAGKMWLRIFPDVPVSRKPAEVRMGSGKGNPEYWMCRVKPGRILMELDGIPRAVAEKAFELAAAKLSVKTKFVVRIGESEAHG